MNSLSNGQPYQHVDVYVLIVFYCMWFTQLKENKKIPLPNGFDDPLEEVDHDAEKLAQEFERKYGNGYDENNGFIDDSEAVNIQFINEKVILFQ